MVFDGKRQVNPSEESGNELPKSKPRRFFTTGFIAYFGAVFSLTGIIIMWEPTTQTISPKDHLSQEVTINPEIKVLASYMKARNSKMPAELAELQSEIIISVAKAEGLPLELVVGIIETETLFDPFSVSTAGAAGLMQTLVEDGVEIDDSKKFDIRYSVEKGCEILHSKLKKSEGNLQRALSAYSGNAENYSERVYASAGKYTLYRGKKEAPEIQVVKN
jgi:hypothetical protein